MPAKVTIESGIAAGASHWIEKPVARIGSDPHCDVCLPSADVPSHAITLEFRNGSYRIYNRCQADVVVGTEVVHPGAAGRWNEGDRLQLNDEIALTLLLEDDPTPMPMEIRSSLPDYADELEYADEAADFNDGGSSQETSPIERQNDVKTEPSTDNSKFLLQLGVTILCVLGAAALLVRESIKDNVADRREPLSFTAVIRRAAETNTSPELVQRLQYAESAVVRGNEKSAQERFGQLRDDLVPWRETFVSENRDSELSILDFVEYRLGQLE